VIASHAENEFVRRQFRWSIAAGAQRPFRLPLVDESRDVVGAKQFDGLSVDHSGPMARQALSSLVRHLKNDCLASMGKERPERNLASGKLGERQKRLGAVSSNNLALEQSFGIAVLNYCWHD
jgi:hypothetical protein